MPAEGLEHKEKQGGQAQVEQQQRGEHFQNCKLKSGLLLGGKRSGLALIMFAKRAIERISEDHLAAIGASLLLFDNLNIGGREEIAERFNRLAILGEMIHGEEALYELSYAPQRAIYLIPL